MMLVCGRRCKTEDEGAVPIIIEFFDHLLYEQPICGYFNECHTAHWGGGLVRDASTLDEWELIDSKEIISWDGFEGNDDDKSYPELFDGEHYDIEEFACKNPDVLETLRAIRERVNKK